jgi:hypothetical protein
VNRLPTHVRSCSLNTDSCGEVRVESKGRGEGLDGVIEPQIPSRNRAPCLATVLSDDRTRTERPMDRVVSFLLGILLILATGCTAANTNPTTVGEGTTTQPTEVESDSTETTVAVARGEGASATLSEGGCAYEGPARMTAGQLRVEMTNETSGQFDLDLWVLDEGHDYEELAAHIDDDRARNEAGEPSLVHPTFATLVAEASAEAGSSGTLTTDLAAGTYGMARILFDQPGSLGGFLGGWTPCGFAVTVSFGHRR